MVQIPDSIRPSVDFVVRHHFWLLLAFVPLLVLPLVLLTRGSLASQIEKARGEIQNRISALDGVKGIAPHPNDAWSTTLDKQVRRIKRETLTEWRRFWESQQPLRVWPASLGPRFVEAVTKLKAGGKLPRSLLEGYQNGVKAIVRAIPARMGAVDMMADDAAGQPGFGAFGPGDFRGRPAGADAAPATNSVVQWSPEDQRRLYASFDWAAPPSTPQVLLAQEELWVYGALCDVIARVNSSSAGAYNAPIPLVQQLAAGYLAAEDDPGASRGGRIVVPRAADAAAGDPELMGSMPGLMPGMPEGEGAVVRPAHPRFVGAAAGAGPMGMPGMPSMEGAPAEGTAVSPDDALRTWIYVNFDGKPLTAEELATSPDAKLVHLMPFLLRAVIDERMLDSLLLEMARAPIPIDVRQLRINPNGRAEAAAGMPALAAPMMPPGFAGGFDSGASAAPARLHDVVVEIRGTVALATPPDPEALGLADAADANSEGEADAPAAEPADPDLVPAAEDAAAPPAGEPGPAPGADPDAPVPVEPPGQPPQARPGDGAFDGHKPARDVDVGRLQETSA